MLPLWTKGCRVVERYKENPPSSKANNYYNDTISLQHEILGVDIAKTQLYLPSGRVFSHLYLSQRRDTIVGINHNTCELIKINMFSNSRKKRGLEEEADVMRDLSQNNCISCPKLLEVGKIDHNHLFASIDGNKYSISSPNENYPFIVQEYVSTSKSINLSDLFLTLLEQRSLGIYHGDLKPANIRYDEKRGICILVDYDQAELIDDKIADLSALEYLKWCDEMEMRKYGHASWLRHFPEVSFEHDVLPLFKNGALNLQKTTLFKRQITTNTPNGVYHTIKDRSICADGIRDLDSRKNILESLVFKKGERVLDVGCNTGILCHYLHDRGCDVTGLEIDPSMVIAAGIIARITKRDINFICQDIDSSELPGHFDTIMLFSVLHHTRNVKDNARKVAKSCNRIIIECRLNESGSKANGRKWEKTSGWNYESVDSLTSALQELFPGFSLFRNYGVGDRNRFIFEYKNAEMKSQFKLDLSPEYLD